METLGYDIHLLYRVTRTWISTSYSILGDLADLIFVFFDPIGQALCKRTLNLVEELNQTHADRMRFFLSKADEAGLEADRQVRLEKEPTFLVQCFTM